MTRAEKFTTIYNAFKAIKTAIIGKGVTVSGDISTFADAINSIPVGSQVVTGQVSGSGTKTLTITNAIGKDNIVAFLINTSTSSVSISAIINVNIIGNDKNALYKNSGNLTKTTATWDKTAGTITADVFTYYFSNNSNTKYVYVAW